MSLGRYGRQCGGRWSRCPVRVKSVIRYPRSMAKIARRNASVVQQSRNAPGSREIQCYARGYAAVRGCARMPSPKVRHRQNCTSITRKEAAFVLKRQKNGNAECVLTRHKSKCGNQQMLRTDRCSSSRRRKWPAGDAHTSVNEREKTMVNVQTAVCCCSKYGSVAS